MCREPYFQATVGPISVLEEPESTAATHSKAVAAAVGELVMLVDNYTAFSDAKGGPLRPGQQAVVERIGSRTSVRGWCLLVLI